MFFSSSSHGDVLYKIRISIRLQTYPEGYMMLVSQRKYFTLEHI